jgi:hypothetical protein|tara:strand:+ start:737 stop:952 length:216 start_codon:yes stop_codon:yes gene_type:complete
MQVFIVSLMLLGVGMLCILLEGIFYQYVETEGVLHESLFMPIGVILVLGAGIGLVFVSAKKLMSMRNKKIN